MKLISSLTLGAVCVLAGCASAPPSSSVDPVASRAVDGGVDYRKVALIDRAARGRGVEVHWINFPQRRPGAPADGSFSPAPDPTTGT